MRLRSVKANFGERLELRQLLIGDSVIHDGRTYVVVGFTPASVIPAEVQLSDHQTGMTFWLDMSLFRELRSTERGALRVVPSEGSLRR